MGGAGGGGGGGEEGDKYSSHNYTILGCDILRIVKFVSFSSHFCPVHTYLHDTT